MAGDDIRSFATRTHDHSQAYESAVDLSAADHGAIGGLGDDDHTQYLLADGTRALSGTMNVTGGLDVEDGTLQLPAYQVGGSLPYEFWAVEDGFAAFTGALKLWDGSAAHEYIPAASTVPEDLALGDTAASGGGAVVTEVAWIDHVHGMPTAAQVGAALVLDDISDVTETTITAGDLLRWNGSAWVNYADSAYEPALAEGAAFPGGPSTGDRYYHTTHDMWFRYDGTRWLCECLHVVKLMEWFTLVASDVGYVTFDRGGLDLYMLEFMCETTQTGTPSGTEYWTILLDKRATDNTNTNILTDDTQTDAASPTWNDHSAAINAVLDVSVTPVLRPSMTLSAGTSTQYGSMLLSYRFIGV